MSKVGKNPVERQQRVDVRIDGSDLVAKGPLGEQMVSLHPSLDVKIEDGRVHVSPKDGGDRTALVMWGTIRALVNNAVEGVAKGFVKELELKGVGYKSALKGSTIILTLGYSHDIEFKLPDGIKAEIPSPTEIRLVGASKELIGQTAAQIRALRPPEPYKGKGVRYKGEFVRHKEGKKK
ncbi:MAG: 50S ribosomal protein L6 [Rickettsiales bacterium]|jgi:large subunit ribosomal protein L6|nr:50S ribosomal protein L6 [Rickettsiales bacterium]